VPDMHQTCTSHFKQADNRIYLLGEMRNELGGSLLFHQLGINGGTPPAMPTNPQARYRLLHQAIQQGWVQSCHDLSEGGLAVALAEMALAGRLGAAVEVGPLGDMAVEEMTSAEILFSESNGRLLLEVAPEHADALEAHFQGQVLLPLGQVTADDRLRIQFQGESVADLAVDQLVAAWKNQNG
jgi:phosphoribosylformylglycinamidine synthase subunit PurSL